MNALKEELLESMDNPDPAIAGGLLAAAVPGSMPVPCEGETLGTLATAGDTLADTAMLRAQ